MQLNKEDPWVEESQKEKTTWKDWFMVITFLLIVGIMGYHCG